MSTATRQRACHYHARVPAVVVELHATGRIGKALCSGCATCGDLRCEDLGTVYNIGFGEPVCAQHAEGPAAGGQAEGPELVEVGSDRHRDALVRLRGRKGRRA